jgi:tRNA threonylcarbamoyl adenosine modification protein YjeE
VTTITIATPDEMAELGARLAAELRAGDILALNGELGAGKTTLTRGLGAALGVRGTVASPTFVLARTHQRLNGGAPLVHVDAYRLSSPAELDDLDIDYAASIVVVEWAAGMLDGLTEDWLEVNIARPTGGGDSDAADVADASDDEDDVEPREVTITGHGARWADFLPR